MIDSNLKSMKLLRNIDFLFIIGCIYIILNYFRKNKIFITTIYINKDFFIIYKNLFLFL
jgi:hypothetical protein